MRAVVRLFTLIAAGLGIQGCDPCFGTANCTVSPRIVITGQIVEAQSAHGVDAIPVSVVRTGGVALETDSVATTTSDGGFWKVEIPALEAGTATVDIVVASTMIDAPYRVVGTEVATVTRKGEAHILPRWVANPYFRHQLEFFLRGTSDERVAGASVLFERRAGVEFFSGDNQPTGTDGAGRAQFFFFNTYPRSLGAVTGDVTIQLPGALGSSTVKGITIEATHLYRDRELVQRVPVGPALSYSFQLFRREDGRKAAGTVVEFKRTGGISLASTTTTATADENGFARLVMRPLERGEVVGELTVRPRPPGSTIVIPGYRFATFESDTGRVINFIVGPYLNYYGFLRLNGQPLVGAQVEVVRTGGIPTKETTLPQVVDNTGVVRFNFTPLAIGEVVLEARFRLPAGQQSFIVSDIRLTTQEQDFPSGVSIWIWDTEKGLTAPPGTTVRPWNP